jgi:hypothetical protein
MTKYFTLNGAETARCIGCGREIRADSIVGYVHVDGTYWDLSDGHRASKNHARVAGLGSVPPVSLRLFQRQLDHSKPKPRRKRKQAA